MFAFQLYCYCDGNILAFLQIKVYESEKNFLSRTNRFLNLNNILVNMLSAYVKKIT